MSHSEAVSAKSALETLTAEWDALRGRVGDRLPSESAAAVTADLRELETLAAVEPAWVGTNAWRNFWRRVARLRQDLAALGQSHEGANS